MCEVQVGNEGLVIGPKTSGNFRTFSSSRRVEQRELSALRLPLTILDEFSLIVVFRITFSKITKNDIRKALLRPTY